MDEFDIEVTDLRESPDTDADDPTEVDEHWRLPARDPFAAPARSRRSRRLRAAFTGAVVLLVASVLLLSIPRAPATLAALLHIPTPAPPLPLPVGADTLVLRHAVPWGELRLDGAPVRHLETALVPPNTQGAQLPALTLARGRHSLRYVAPPFPTLRCAISVPAAPSDTCPLAPQEVAGPLETFGLARIVDLGATPALLPQRQHDALVSAVAAALAAQSSTTMLAAGEPYLTAGGAAAVAREPLVATLRYTLDSGTYTDSFNGEGMCRPLCADAHDQASYSGWLLTGRLDLSWQYLPTAGQPFAGAVAQGTQNPIAEAAVLVTWSGAWQVTLAPLFGEPECAAAATAVRSALEEQALSARLACEVAPRRAADGCLVTVQPLDAAGLPVGPVLALYYRFGVLFAGDTAARHRLPKLSAVGPAALALLPAP